MKLISRMGLLVLLGHLRDTEAVAAPCLLNDDESACIGDTNGCVWTQPTLGVPGSCGVEPCKFTDELNCNADKSCEWESLCPKNDDHKCVRHACFATTQKECEKNSQCQWSSGLKCQRSICGKYPTESCCRSEDCQWNTGVSPPVCVEKPCTRNYKTESLCNKKSGCMWDAGKGYCTEMNCNGLGECSCRNAQGCYWHIREKRCVDEEYGQCPALEVVVAVDASSSVRGAFYRHSNGWYAFWDLLKDWANQIPLTGEKRGVTDSGLTRGGIRLGTIQFSGQEPYTQCGQWKRKWYGKKYCARYDTIPGTTEARVRALSGVYSELSGDISYHRANPLNKGNRIEKGMREAGNVFNKAAKNRKKVMFIFVDSGMADYASTTSEVNTLNSQGVTRFGIVLRRSSSQSSAENNAAVQLRKLTSSASLSISMTHDAVAANLFKKICEPSSTFGKYIVGSGVQDNDQVGYHLPCKQYTNAYKCAVDRGCHWSSSSQACLDSVCITECEKTACMLNTDNYCVWDTTQGCLKETRCAHDTYDLCIASSQNCVWDGTAQLCEPAPCTMNDNELDCKSDHEDCSWVSKKCVVRPCTRPDTKPDCVKDGNGKECAWQKDPCGGPELQCMHAGCKAWTSSTVCKADARCQWVNSKCAFKTCSENDNDECCDARAECHWDLKTTPATCQIKECYTLTTNAKCEANKDCMWNESPKGCVDLHCQFHLTQCACMRNDNCYWKSGSEEQCVAAKYGLCPAMDIVLIFPGSTSMSYKFEHHPNGYLAFTEHIRNWVREIPLTKAPAGVTTQSGNTEAARVSLIQYGTDGSAAKIATAPAAKGQLSGTFAQLDSDLTWHEDNPVGGDHKILPALKLAYKNFNERDWKDSPPDDGVERILIIVTDQQILDTDDTKDVIDNMDFLRVNRYGIVVRRQATATKVDVDASASLKKLTSADQSKHFTDLNLDELPDLLHKFCDPVHEWGSNIEHIVPGTTINKHLPCMFYLQEATCKKDRGCFWSTSTKTCTTSPCLEHCTAADCHAENNMECSWTNVHCENIPDTVCDCKYDEADLAANKRHCETEPDKCSWKGTLCVIDQCATGSTGDIICKSNGQQCVDPDPSPCTDDWYCECVAPLTRDPYTSPTQAKAVCVLNECLASCSTCENGACAKKDQDCFDHNSAPTSTEDWGCRCRSPFEGAAIGKVATCAINECNVTCDHCENGLCATAGQGCNDPDDTNSSDWACLCPEPSVMYEIGAVVDQCLFDECLEYNGTCTDVDQVCVEPDDSVYNDWYCECKPPGDGQAAMAAAVCILNECEATCTGCENGVCQSTWPPQTCFDPDQNASSTGDWRCVCPNDPSASARGGVVNCPFDECTEDCTTTCEQGRCAKGHLGQTCSDPNPTLNSRWDWMCVCPYPSSKTRTGGDVASCSQDECELHNTCQNRQQTCTDLDENKPDDWQCTCVAPLNGSAMTEAANCTIDECDKTCDSCEKGACDSGPVSQTCNDPDHSELSTGDWTCTCPAPSTLYATKSVANCPLDECKEACPTCAGATCSANKQSCSDPIPMSKSLSNWVCACDAPANYTQLTAPVQSCDIDECTLHNETCNDANQDCHDPNHSIGFDWLCVCRSPLSGSELNGIADCAIDECNTTCSTCENGKCDTGVLPQTCSDPDHSEFSTSDWTCTCPSPSFNAATQNLADCPLDECDAICPSCEQDACANASQTCYDPFPMTSSLSDWNCTCQYPSNATEQAAAVASCDRDECEIHAPTCEAANQTCYDVNASIPHDWMCACRSPLSGEETSKVAACFVDECVSSCESCEEGLCSTGDPIETCDDPNNSSLSLSDWTCTCPFPSTRFATVNKADCPRDECIVDGCSTCANGTCAQSGQNCSDPVAMTSSLSDWVCSCPFPSNATATAAAAATCDTNECDISRYNMICMVAGQECVDPDESVTDDWMCRCVWPLSGHATGSAVNCTIDECEENCQTCERDMCSSAYPVQICHDPDHSSDSQSDWICACQAPSNNTGYTNLASCPLNECEDTMCATCANGTCVRGDGDQTCTDPGPSSSSLSDWFCRCAAPANYTQTAAAVVSCSIDECTIHNSTCTRGNQTCEDLDQAAHYNWECVCNDPLSGRGTMELAECTIDECEVTCGTCENSMCETGAVEETCTDLNISALSRQDWACSCPAPSTISAIYNLADCPLDECSVTCATCSNQTCTDAGQTCYDPEPRSESLSDWICSCVPPAMQKAVASAADICAYDECLSFNATCASANQTCEDPNWETYSDWVCWCPLPFEGNATAGISHCEINECEKTCASCEEDLCATAGQSCEDPDSSWKSLSDWLCRCPEPSVGHAFTSVSHCTLNECNTTCPHCANTICSGASQLCDDPNTTASSTNDWWCRCPSPSLGLNKTSAVDFCLYDECSVPENENVCLNHTQECVDVDTEVFSLDDWECNCISPPALENNSTVTGPTLCSYQGECETDPEALLCLAKGHLCWDPDTDIHSLGDWECSCVTPFKGETAVNSSDILCEVNECETNCSTCAITNEYPNQPNLCEIEGQTCTDLNLTTLHDWQCQCPFPSTTLASTATPAPACVVDECLAVCPSCSKGACTSVNQTCVDPDTDVNSLSDWTCTCPSPGVGDATAKAALCVCDECLLYSDCPDAWQSCYDADTTCNNVQPDFVCTCPPGSNGTAIGEAVAMCTIDECVEFGDTCALSGQTCVDDDKMTNGTWVCHCPMPANGSALMAVSSCTLDECLKDCKHCENDTCASAKQDCTDPDTRLESSHDWFCECRFPGVGKATARAASCDCDECVTDVICSSANQTCNDGNLTCADGGAKDYTCTCQDPFTGVAEAAVAVCKWDECAEHELACTNKKQNCYDPDLVNLDTWQCVCLPNATGSALMQAAECSLDECAAICDSCENSACENAGQKCNDPDIAITSLGDWTCECNVGTGKATQAPADCKCDECLDTLECDLADQICTDSNHTCGGGDFTCSCKLPWQGVGTAGAAVCEMDECKQNGYVCQAMNQTCTDYELTTENTWSCTCPLPSHGTSNMSAAACVLDECEESCPHCENGACEEEAQLCIDMDNSSQSRRDWMCLCQEPGVGNATAKPAECVCNECLLYSTCTNAGQDCNDLETSCSKLQKPNYVCTCRAPSFGSANNVAADCQLDECQDNQLCGGQKCEDPDFLKNGDWFCKCPPPSHGSAVGEPATCILNECNETCSHCANGTCTQQTDKQTCHDPDTNATSTSDWTCTCSIGVGSATAKAATCVCDECSIGINACQPFGQDCRDNVQTCNTAPDFQCMCPSPYTGSAVGTNATCTLDECKQYASICSAVGQDCIDSDHLVLNNWICQCKSPSEGEGRMEAAYCVLDECAKECETCSNNTCTDADQICSEGNTSSLMTSDWTCSCKFPGVGSAVTNAAVCVCDECLMFDVCQSEGQSCFDADKSCDKLDDFTCTCALPAVGTGTASAAVCLTNECKQYNGTCLTKGQTCFDPNQTVADDWECHCPEPAVGTEVMGPATCFLNECNTSCTHCANGTCDSVGQTCNDPNMEVDYTNDWTCTCVAPAKGEAMANAAECVCNECETDDTCLAANQSCEDVNTTCGEVPDFVCSCELPAYGSAVGEAAECLIDECTTVLACESMQQICLDENRTADANWICMCPNGTTGEPGQQGATTCLLDECTASCPTCAEDTCSNMGQACVEQNKDMLSLNDWECHCYPPLTGKGRLAPADCSTYDECTTNAETCIENCRTGTLDCQQTCYDPNTTASVRDDWVCVCPAPSTDYAVAGAAVCTVAPCLHDTEKPCLEDLAGCTWDKESDPMCYKTPCVTAKKTVCEEDAACVWSSYSPSAATAALVYEMSTAIFPFENVTCFTIGCFTCDAPQPGIRVEFVKGYLPEKDSLACATCSAANVSLNFNKETGVLQMGPATSRSLLTALAGLSFITQTDDASKRTLSWRFGTTADGSDATTCTTGPHTVDLVMGHCALLRCEYTDASKCTDDAACLWVGGNMDPCTVAPCVEYPSEKSCNRDEACEYSVDSADAGCVLRRCPLLETERECLVEDVCMWNAGACVDKDCSIVDERCACEQEKTCAWVALGSQGRCVGEEFGTCPAMDITVLLSGSVSLSGAFARHPKGFYAIIETLRDWVTALPLTSEGSAVGKQSTAANGGMRLAFIQFSGTPAKNAIQTPAGVGASGSFSGKRSELTGDLIWHEDNFLQGGNIVTTGLGRAADLFSADSAAGRKRVLIVLSDTKIEGVEGSADAIAALRSLNVEVFGCLLRRTSTYSDSDSLAMSLSSITSEPASDHFVSVQLDALYSDVLGAICNPSSTWGAVLAPTNQTVNHIPCARRVDKDDCTADIGCIYTTSLTCIESPCLSYCDATECTKDQANECQWVAVNNLEGCWKTIPCRHTDESICKDDEMCSWSASMNECGVRKCYHTTEPECDADGAGCKWLRLDKKCIIKPCSYTASEDCTADGACMWDGCSETCEENLCEAGAMQASRGVCTSNFQCEWVSDVCQLSTCGRFGGSEMCCNQHTGCKWDTSASTAVCGTEHCSSLTAEGATVCNGDAGCTYDATMRSCEEFRCKYHGKSHACRTDSNCFWNTNEGSCTEVQYGSCPTLDIVVLFDGSSALSQSFGKHPQAFVGILEIFRDWLREFPLAAGSSATGGAQVLFVQFAGGASAQAKVNTESSGAQGQPSGVLSELNTDLTWHENEFYGSAGPSKVEKALEEALAALSGSQTRTASKKVVLIVAGGEISDASEVASQRSALEKIGASIFGVFVRRFETETDADKTALKSLTNTVSVPKDVHVTSVDISSLYSGALHTFCDANTGFGQDIADVSPTHNPCTVYLERSTCLEDSFCSWLDESTCVTTPCVHHTDELTCNADDTNACKYNQTMAECERRVVKPCLERTAAECLETDGCAVSDDGLTCGEKTCYHGSEQSCRSDVNDCVWVGGPLGCEKRKCSHKTEEACSANATCSWVVAGVAGEGAATFAKFTEVGLFPDHQCTASLCADASCSTVLPSTESLVVKITEGYQQGKDTLFCRLCLSLGIQASWDAPSSTLSLSTVNGLAVLSYSQALANVSFSTVSDDDTVRDFAWSFVGDKCATGKGSAEVVAASCQVKRCQYDAQPLCNSDPYCQWNVTTCSQKLCTHINSELTCGRQEECHWSVDSSEGMCMQRACAKFKDSMDMCKSNSGCMWDDTKTVKCIETDCKVMESCRCQQDSDCFWRASEGACVAVDFALCPLMDVVFAFSGASAFGVPYGKHPHGFYAVVEMLRDWVGQAPLTTEKASIGAQSVETSGVRVALIQFAGKRTANLVVGSVATAPGSSGAGGQLSGDLGEVAGDLNWHEANYKGQDRFVSRALTTAAMTFNMDSPKDGRKKVVIVIADGALDDESVADARASLDALGVQTFVVLVHRFSSETPEDTQATKALAQLASSDNHFASVPLNELSGTVLNSLCDPTSTWGSLLLNATAISTDGNHKPCAFYSEQSTCTTDTACAWSTGYSVCLPSRCTSNCEKTTCTDECEWDDTLARCLAYVPETRLKCVSAVEEVCLSDSDCLYDVASGICATRACYHEDEEGCIADATGCGWSTVNQTCSAKQCAAGDRESCVAESMCEWEETCGAGCIVKPCAHAGESTCAGDPQCEWLNGECAVLPCAGYANEKCCDQFDDCQWDVRTSPAVCAVRPCVTAAGKDACDAESGCMWFGAPEKCVEKSCDLLGTDDKCACNADTDCYFVSAATGAHCTLQQYGSCPTMDIVMLLDGGASMSTVFGRHPVGFYGLIEIIRQWAKHLPLSKDTADVTAPLADTQTTRLSFVQFAGSSEWDAGDSRQILTPGITDPGTSGGRLTGSLSEINTDLTFHSDNPLAQGSGKAKKYLSAALDKAGKMLGTSPVDGRKKVVIVLVNGELDDASEYRGYKTVLNALQAEVFGAALSRAGTDAGAVSDLNNYVVSEPKEGRARSVTLDTLGEVLSSLCDPMDAWGQYLVDESTSCAQATLRKTCLKNGGCTWSDQLLTCESSPCIAHCDELACEADTTNNCAGGWNSTTHTCHRVVNCHYTEEPRCSDDFDCQWSDGQCAERPCAHSTEDGCSSDAAAGCEWTLNATCVVRACVTIDNQVSCEADSAEHNCVWSSVTGQCLVEQCGYIGKEACTADDLCSWGAEGCAFKLCTMYADDFECSSHPRCSWDVSAPPGMCRVTTCGTHDSEAECGHYNTSCMWSTGGNETADGACVKKGCQDVGSACECASNAECFWSVGDGYDCQAAAFGQCPAMDVLFAVDGSQNMASSFGRHPNGFAAVLEFVMDWTMQAPLTGGKPSKGVRVAMFQFSTGVTTGDNGGKLSGDAALIAKNVAWHAGSMNGGSSVAAGSALATALGLFKTEATAKGRVQVAVLITSQAVGDSGDLSSVQAQLEQARVITVGIALRRFSTVQDQDEKNTKTLALVAGSTDRVVSLVADDVLEQFMDLCKPSTKWGALVASRQTEQIAPFAAKSCAQLFKPADCTKDLACEWSYGTSTCTAAGCSMHCDDESCGADDACAWEGAEAICQKVTPCGYSQQAACEADDLCNWVASDETCAVDESPCAYPSERACSGDYDCEWTDGACSSFQPCDERAKEDCEESKNSKRGRCEWSIRDGKCGVNSVRGECDEGCCTCLTGWGGRECSVCDFDVANDGSCTVCDKDTTCSTHGECATSGICLCDPGWTGIDCSEHVCEPAGAHWYTAFPNSPVSGETFTLIVHGCFPDNSSFHSVRLVQGNSSCDVEPEDRCQTSRGTLSMSRSKCDDVSQRDSAKLEPTAQQEILVDVRAYTADKSEYTVCWNHPSEGWRRLATHTRNGNRAGTLKVSAQQNGDTGAAAASTIEEDGSPCCEGLSLGSACVPQGAAVAFYVLTLALVLGVGIMVLKSKSELNTLAAIKAGDESVYTYEEFDMEEQSNLGASTRLEASLISNEITSLGGSMLRSTPSGVASSIVPDVRL